MNKELYKVLDKIKKCMLYKNDITLNKKEIHLLLKYITTLEKIVAGENE